MKYLHRAEEKTIQTGKNTYNNDFKPFRDKFLLPSSRKKDKVRMGHASS